MKKKVIKIMLTLLLSVILLLLFVVACFSFGERIMFWSFYSNAERYEKIPGLWDKYVPQGYNKVDGKDLRLACGYMSDGTASRIYVMRDGEDAVAVEMKNADGSACTSHTGGIDVLGDNVYISGDVGCDIFSLDDILDGDGVATATGKVKTINDPAYCIVKDGRLYCGSFYREGNYETPDSHKITTPAGDKNTSIISVYTLDPSTGHACSETPDFVISTPSLVQAMEFIDESTMALATSYGLSKSHIYIHDISALSENAGEFEVDGVSVPLYYLDSSTQKKDIIAPPMAEQIFYDNGFIYIMNESASTKYLFGKLTSGNYVYGYEYD